MRDSREERAESWYRFNEMSALLDEASSRDRTFRRPVVTGDGRPVLSAVASEDSLEETVVTAPEVLLFLTKS